eukprot:2596517-Pleurochrysis_carterae.AAC.1
MAATRSSRQQRRQRWHVPQAEVATAATRFASDSGVPALASVLFASSDDNSILSKQQQRQRRRVPPTAVVAANCSFVGVGELCKQQRQRRSPMPATSAATASRYKQW